MRLYYIHKLLLNSNTPTHVCTLQDHVHQVSPAFILIYPCIGIGSIVFSVPLILYLSFSREFEHLHPLWLPHYLFLARHVLKTLVNNDMKVRYSYNTHVFLWTHADFSHHIAGLCKGTIVLFGRYSRCWSMEGTYVHCF